MNEKFLQALASMGVKAITFEVNYPTLTAAYYGASGATTVESVLSFYDETTKKAREAGLKIAAANGKTPMVFETWAYKTAPQQLGHAALNDVFARDAFAFQAPIDIL